VNMLPALPWPKMPPPAPKILPPPLAFPVSPELPEGAPAVPPAPLDVWMLAGDAPNENNELAVVDVAVAPPPPKRLPLEGTASAAKIDGAFETPAMGGEVAAGASFGDAPKLKIEEVLAAVVADAPKGAAVLPPVVNWKMEPAVGTPELTPPKRLPVDAEASGATVADS